MRHAQELPEGWRGRLRSHRDGQSRSYLAGSRGETQVREVMQCGVEWLCERKVRQRRFYEEN